MNRRKFIPVAVGGAVVAAAGIGYLTRNYWSPGVPSPTTPSPTVLPTETPTPKPLKAAFDYSPKPKYILQDPNQAIDFKNLTEYSGNSKPACQWGIANKSVSQDWNYSTKLEPGKHDVRLSVRDDKTNDWTSADIEVDEYDPSYAEKKFKTQIKGLVFGVGQPQFGHPTENDSFIDESISIIRNELKCNGLKIEGFFDLKIKTAAERAIQLGFDQIVLGPRYVDQSWEAYVDSVRRFAPIAEELRLKSSAVIFQVGLELLLDSRAIFKEETYPLRWANAGKNLQKDPQCHSKLNRFVEELMDAARESFNGDLTYASAYWERIDWDRVKVPFISATEYYDPNYAEGIAGSLQELKSEGKPVIVAEFGSCTYPGAWEHGGSGWSSSGIYDEEEQVRNIERYVNIFNGIGGLHACYLYMFYQPKNPPNPAQEWSIVKLTEPNSGKFSRKKSFHKYASYIP